MDNKSHLHWTVVGYNHLDKKTNNLIDASEIEVQAVTESEAMDKAKQIITTKKLYRVHKVRECFNVDGQEFLQLQHEALSELKKHNESHGDE